MSSAERQSEDREPGSKQIPASLQDVNGKLLLPRPTQGWPRPASSPKRRSHACERCRVMKVRCSGGARCKKCVEDNQVCLYGDNKREKNKKYLEESREVIDALRQQNHELIGAFRHICSDPYVQVNKYPSIIRLLAKNQNLIDPQTSQAAHTSGLETPHASRTAADQILPIESIEDATGETASSFSGRSPEVDDRLSTVVDLEWGAGAAGYIGKMSEVSWAQRARQHLFRHSVSDITQDELDMHDLATQGLNYFIDDTDLLSVDEEAINAFDWPHPGVALMLSESYFGSLHHCFPFVDQKEFLDKLIHVHEDKIAASWSERRWLSMANLIFALGSKHLNMGNRADVADHLVYYARARALGLDHRLLFDHPLFEQIQSLGILGLYLFVNHSVSRAWTVIGHAIRHAISMGLHLKVWGDGVGTQQKKMRAQAWYSLYNLEVALMEITGRPGSISLQDMTTPTDGLDQESEFEAQPTFLTYRVRLSVISHRISFSVYTGGRGMPWSDLQDAVRLFHLELQQFLADLPGGLTVKPAYPFEPSLSRVELELYYWSLQITLHRPCLIAPGQHLENESPASAAFHQKTAVICIESALSMMALLPRQPEAAEIYRRLPWWNLLHFFGQAATVLIIELCHNASHCPTRLTEVVDCLKTILSYLRYMSAGSPSVFKAWRIFRQLLADATSRLGIDDSNVPHDAPEPLGWNAELEYSLVKTLRDTA